IFSQQERGREMKSNDVDLSRTIPGPADAVFDVWLDPKSPGSPWFGVERVILDPVVDGLFYHLVKWEGREWAHYGRFITLERGRRIEHTWMSEATSGCETIVTVTLEPREGGTVVRLRHAGLPDDKVGGHAEGWGALLSALLERFSKK